MKLVINNQNEIIEYAILGDIPNSEEFTAMPPDDFESNFKPSFYLLQNNEIVKNTNYKESVESIPMLSTTPLESQVAALAYQHMTAQQTITDLQTQNAQMAYQLMTQGGAVA
ncbi:hypothetical protein BSQ39_12985 [Loigolactobacillus backii]|uniref:DUF2977 domain-containing protein n=1 Tax=Loigolactobacillus backii TaxID=375175 RepID=UPI000C1C8846|nr:DUF2977 domain-containing protein [Loigolactobacillus backii]PIO79999.1 hypothetical protein BSQ39_12985 [Loigolactobacillus backii]